MTKLQFILSLSEKLKGLQKDEFEERLSFYSEMIEDSIEDGMSEEDAVAAIGSVDEIAAGIVSSENSKTNKSIPQKTSNPWVITLLILGFPLWLSLLAAAFAVIISLFASLWSVIISLWAVFGALIVFSVGALLKGIVIACQGNILQGLILFAMCLVSAGLSIFTFFGCKYATMGSALLTKNLTKSIINSFRKKEKKQ